MSFLLAGSNQGIFKLVLLVLPLFLLLTFVKDRELWQYCYWNTILLLLHLLTLTSLLLLPFININTIFIIKIIRIIKVIIFVYLTTILSNHNYAWVVQTRLDLWSKLKALTSNFFISTNLCQTQLFSFKNSPFIEYTTKTHKIVQIISKYYW